MGVFRRQSHNTTLPVNSELPDNVRPIRASAEAVSFAKFNRAQVETFRRARTHSKDQWQASAWQYYDFIGEINFAFNLVANLAARCRIYPAVVTDPSRPPVHVDETTDLTPGLGLVANQALARLQDDDQDMSGLLRYLVLNLQIVGECYLVRHPEQLSTRTPARWKIHSVDEVIISQDSPPKVQVRTSEADRTSDIPFLPPDTFIARIWDPHPRFSKEPTSSMKAVLPLCSELVLLNQAIQSLASSRLNAGALFLPDTLSASRSMPPVADIASSENTILSRTPTETDAAISAVPVEMSQDEDSFEEELLESMVNPIQDPSSASSVVPLIIRGPAEAGQQIRHITFDRPFDETLIARAEKVMERILSGINVPKDIVSGLSGLRFSNAVVQDESFLRGTVEPILQTVCHALSTAFLHPFIVAHGFTPEQAKRVIFHYDPSAIVGRPNKNQDAISLYDRHQLSGSAARKAAGFSETDKASPTETLTRLVIERGSLTPQLSEALLRVLAPNMMQEATEQASATSENPLPPEVQQALAGTPTGNPPPEPTQVPGGTPGPTPAPAAPSESPAPGGTMPPVEFP